MPELRRAQAVAPGLPEVRRVQGPRGDRDGDLGQLEEVVSCLMFVVCKTKTKEAERERI